MDRRAQLFMRALQQELKDRGDTFGLRLLADMLDEAGSDPEYRDQLESWAKIGGMPGTGTTVALRSLCLPFGEWGVSLRATAAIDEIDAASLAARDAVPTTARDIEGRLFAPRSWDTGWEISLQADKAGYACSPQDRLASLEDYTTLEAIITGPGGMTVDPGTLGLPEDLVAKFTPLSGGGSPSIGLQLTWSDVDHITDALNRAGMNPNTGVPPGSIGWQSCTIWHGTDSESGQDIVAHGIRMEASSRGYFGPAFYAADQRDLAASNYAEMCGDNAGSLVRLEFEDGVRILDLRNAKDAESWAPYADRVGEENFDRLMRKSGIDAVYDRSMGGFAIYRAAAVRVLGLEDPKPQCDPEENDAPEP